MSENITFRRINGKPFVNIYGRLFKATMIMDYCEDGQRLIFDPCTRVFHDRDVDSCILAIEVGSEVEGMEVLNEKQTA